jgi:hypothetical protein
LAWPSRTSARRLPGARCESARLRLLAAAFGRAASRILALLLLLACCLRCSRQCEHCSAQHGSARPRASSTLVKYVKEVFLPAVGRRRWRLLRTMRPCSAGSALPPAQSGVMFSNPHRQRASMRRSTHCLVPLSSLGSERVRKLRTRRRRQRTRPGACSARCRSAPAALLAPVLPVARRPHAPARHAHHRKCRTAHQQQRLAANSSVSTRGSKPAKTH